MFCAGFLCSPIENKICYSTWKHVCFPVWTFQIQQPVWKRYIKTHSSHTNKWIFQPTLWRTARGHSQWHCCDENVGTRVHRDIHNAVEEKKTRSLNRKNVNIKTDYTSMLRSKDISYNKKDMKCEDYIYVLEIDSIKEHRKYPLILSVKFRIFI